MEDRVLFGYGEQRRFLLMVIGKLNCSSLRGILQFGFDIPYSTLKNYSSGRRLLPKALFLDLCHIAKINSKEHKIKYISGNWGQIKGGKKSRK
jgi:hypothetical protein